MLAQPDVPWSRKLSDAAEMITWKALNAGPEDWKQLRELPVRLWEKRRQLPTLLVSAGMSYMQRRQQNGNGRAEDA